MYTCCQHIDTHTEKDWCRHIYRTNDLGTVRAQVTATCSQHLSVTGCVLLNFRKFWSSFFLFFVFKRSSWNLKQWFDRLECHRWTFRNLKLPQHQRGCFMPTFNMMSSVSIQSTLPWASQTSIFKWMELRYNVKCGSGHSIRSIWGLVFSLWMLWNGESMASNNFTSH